MCSPRCVFKCEAFCGVLGAVVGVIAVACFINPKLNVYGVGAGLGMVGIIVGICMLAYVYFTYLKRLQNAEAQGLKEFFSTVDQGNFEEGQAPAGAIKSSNNKWSGNINTTGDASATSILSIDRSGMNGELDNNVDDNAEDSPVAYEAMDP